MLGLHLHNERNIAGARERARGLNPMPLTMRPSGLASTGYYKDHADYLIFCGGWNIGRIYEIRSGPEELRWFWALHFPGRPENLRTDNRAGSLEAAKEEFEECWRKWKAWAKLEEVA
jgi:hypothetical protein